MNLKLIVATLLLNLIAFQSYSQCSETHLLCSKQFSKENKGQGWSIDQQSESVSVEKGKVYETSIMAYKGMEYRLSACAAIASGLAVKFQLFQDVMVTVQDDAGNSSIQKERKTIFDNTIDNEEFYVIFRSNKSEKFYISLSVPSSGKSKAKKLESPNHICIGILLEQRKTTNSAL